MKDTINIGIVGFGLINQELSRQSVSLGKIKILWILDRSFNNVDLFEPRKKDREEEKKKAYQYLKENGHEPKIYNNYHDMVQADKVDVIVEATGDDVIELIRWKRKVWGEEVLFVTANKSMIAKHLEELLSAKDIKLEAAVAAGLPLIKSLANHISVDKLEGLVGIINGTTNYILCEMQKEKPLKYEEALLEAVKKGYAEPGGAGDVDGKDAANKLLILARIVNLACVKVDFIFDNDLVRGIDASNKWKNIDCVRAIDFIYAQEYLNSTIKLIAVLQDSGEGNPPLFLIYPMLISNQCSLANIEGADNYIEIYSKHFGYTDMQGRGAGKEPTACALLSDVMTYPEYINNVVNQPFNNKHVLQTEFTTLDNIKFERFMIRASCYDRAGVLAHIFKHFEQHQIGIDEVFQIRPNDSACTNWANEMDKKDIIPFVFTTTKSSILSLMNALDSIDLNIIDAKGDKLFPDLNKLFAVYPILNRKTEKNGIKEFLINDD